MGPSWLTDLNTVDILMYKQNTLRYFISLRLALFAEENPDILSFETIPSYDEAIAIARAMSDPFTSKGIPAWIAFACKDEHHVASGETIIKCAEND